MTCRMTCPMIRDMTRRMFLRPARRALLAALLALPIAALPIAARAFAETATDPAELARSWNGARVWLPQAPNRAADVQALETAQDLRGVVLYAHGCDGLSRISNATGRFLARAGLAVVAPDGFARQHKPVSCVPVRRQGSLHRAVLAWRHAELLHALERLGTIAALADLPVVLMGHSEGAISVATMQAPPVAARIIEGWTCHAGWPEYRGLAARAEEPVLALVGANDPWFRLPALQGDCGAFMAPHAAARSVVFRAPHPLHARHWLSFDAEVQELILGFIARSLDGSAAAP